MSDIQALQKEIKLLRTLGTRQGFFNFYFDQLPEHRTQVETFNYVNDLHFELFGEYRYESYHSFRNQVSHFNRKK